MDPITVIWSMTAAACATLAFVHLLIYLRQRSAPGNLLLTTAALSAALIAAAELAMMKALTPQQFGAALRWAHVPLVVMMASFVLFVRLHLGAGRTWLMWSVIATCLLTVTLNFALPPNINYKEIKGLRPIVVFGNQTAVVATGTPRPLAALPQFSNLLLLAYLADAAITLRRRGAKRSDVGLCWSMTVFVAISGAHAALVVWGVVRFPFVVSLTYLGIVVTMSYELGSAVIHAAAVARQLQTSERELRESEARMDLAATAAGLIMWRWDAVGDRIWMSDQGREYFGLVGVDGPLSIGQFMEAVYPEDREVLSRALNGAMKGAGGYECEFRISRGDNGPMWVASRGRVEFGDDGSPLWMTGVAVDVTPRKRAEAEVLLQRAELAHLARVAVAGELSGALAHELNQPLTAIMANAQAGQRLLAQEPPDVTEVGAILTDIVADERRAAEVIRRMRLLLKKGELQRTVLDVNEVVRDVLKLVRGDMVYHGIGLRTELAEGLPAVDADRVQMQQVLLNLIMNACDAMRGVSAGARELLVTSATGEGGSVRVEVWDRGCGIPADVLNRVFEPFYTTKSHGMGLGLSVCRTIVSAHGGQMWAANRDDGGGGARFVVELPAAREAPTQVQPATAAAVR